MLNNVTLTEIELKIEQSQQIRDKELALHNIKVDAEIK